MAEHKSPRYEKRETTTFPDKCFGDHGIKIKDNVTGKTGYGFAGSKTKAEDKAFHDIEVKNLQHRWEQSAKDWGDSSDESELGQALIIFIQICVYLFLIGFVIHIAEDGWPQFGNNKKTGSPVVDISSTPPSQRPAMYVPAIRMPNENCVGLYLCTEDNYNPKEWRVTSKTVSRTFKNDEGRTWHTIWGSKTSRYIIHDMKVIDNREGGERSLCPNKRDLFLVIEEP